MTRQKNTGTVTIKLVEETKVNVLFHIGCYFNTIKRIYTCTQLS